MNISAFSIKRPVFATVLNITIVLFGIVGYTFLAVRDYPAIDPPVINVTTSYAGANANIIESQITEPLEKVINGIPGIRSISSSSSNGKSNINIEFNLGEDLESSANDVRDKVGQSLRNLPQDVDAPPVVTKSDANSDFIILVGVQSHSKGLMELSEYAEDVLQEKLQTIPEVSAVNILGQKRPSMRIWTNPEKMNVYNISFSDIKNALDKENIEVPSGKLYGKSTELTIKVLGKLLTEDDFKNLILKQDADGIVRLNDVAKVELGPESEEFSWHLNGVNAVGVSITPQPGANYIRIADEFYKRIEEIKKSQNNDIQLTTLIDNTQNVRKSIREVADTLLISLSLVVLVIFFFFRNILIAVRPLIDIPISLIATFFIMYIAGFSINILTLLAIVLATGLVVDDGIVVTENIFRKLEEGLPIRKAALEGSKEIFFVVISTSITLAVVFLPVIFLQGFVGSLFREFGVVISVAVLISALVSLTITPVLNVLLNRKKQGHGKFYDATEPFFKGMENGYRNLLQGFLKIRWIAWMIVLICIGLIYYFMNNLQSEIAPLEDKSTVRFLMTGPEGVSYDYMVDAGDQFVNFLYDSIPEKDFVFSAIPGFAGTGVNSGFGRVKLVSPSQRNRSQSDIVKDISKKLPQFNQIRISAIQEQTISVGLSSRGSLPVQFILQNLDFDKLKTFIPKFLEEARKDKTFLTPSVDANLKFNKPEVQVSIDRVKARAMGINISDVGELLQGAFSGRRLGYYIMNGKQYQVIGQVAYKDRQSPQDISDLYVRNSRGENIPLSAVVIMKENSNPSTLFHFNRYKSATIQAGLAEGMTIGDGVKAMQRISKKVLDNSFQTELSGPSRDFAESNSNTSFAFMLALMLIYLVLAAQFESFKDPLIIMITVPLALAGALLSLWLFDMTINIFSQIGMIMLIGLVTKNGILIVEFANKKRISGMDKNNAVLDAAQQRLRPILMTSLATALGALPIAMSLGSASSSRVPLGIVIVGGLLFSLVLTLFVIPAIYTFISGKHQSLNNDTND
ncbi:MAG: efflux RND transporter permease subunit [Bacteroidota bacterium]